MEGSLRGPEWLKKLAVYNERLKQALVHPIRAGMGDAVNGLERTMYLHADEIIATLFEFHNPSRKESSMGKARAEKKERMLDLGPEPAGMRINLGDYVRAECGIEGRVKAITLWEANCTHIGIVRSGLDKDGEPFKLHWEDEPYVTVIERPEGVSETKLAETTKPGGPSLSGYKARETR